MSKHVEVVALHRPDGSGQVTQVSVRVVSLYPIADAQEACRHAVAGLLDAINQLCDISEPIDEES